MPFRLNGLFKRTNAMATAVRASLRAGPGSRRLSGRLAGANALHDSAFQAPRWEHLRTAENAVSRKGRSDHDIAPGREGPAGGDA